MPRLLTPEEKARVADIAVAAERARRTDAAAISVYVDNTANEDGTIGYHAVVRIDARVRWTDAVRGDPSTT